MSNYGYYGSEVSDFNRAPARPPLPAAGGSSIGWNLSSGGAPPQPNATSAPYPTGPTPSGQPGGYPAPAPYAGYPAAGASGYGPIENSYGGPRIDALPQSPIEIGYGGGGGYQPATQNPYNNGCPAAANAGYRPAGHDPNPAAGQNSGYRPAGYDANPGYSSGGAYGGSTPAYDGPAPGRYNGGAAPASYGGYNPSVASSQYVPPAGVDAYRDEQRFYAHEGFKREAPPDANWSNWDTAMQYKAKSVIRDDSALEKTKLEKQNSITRLVNLINKLSKSKDGTISQRITKQLEKYLGKMISNAAQRFLGVDKETGRIIGAIGGNLVFKMGGKGNKLDNMGKVILENIVTGKFKRKNLQPFVSPAAGASPLGIDFYRERQRCLERQILFEDQEFPATDASLYHTTPPRDRVVWKRPGEIVQYPQLIVCDQSRFDVKQGALGDCWFLAAVANLTMREELFYRVVPPDQSFTENYAGIFHFQFWRYGKWVDVVVDDRLPTVNGKLLYLHSEEKNEFWSALLEKAYAKLYGCYENLVGGFCAEALEDFTGGLTEFYELRALEKETLLSMLMRGLQMGSIFGCSIEVNGAARESLLKTGLLVGHAYSITALQAVKTSRGTVPLVRIRNPWGNATEWNGAWSDNSREWREVGSDDRKRIELNFAKDGEFWMSFDDFYANFSDIEICNLSANVMNEIAELTGVDMHQINDSEWSEESLEGEWSRRRGTAGGCENFDTFSENPQFECFFNVTSNTLDDDGKISVIVAVLQKYRREMQTLRNANRWLSIGFSVFRVEENMSGPFDKQYFRRNRPVAEITEFRFMREITCRFRVPPGRYVIVPCTFTPQSDGEFMLRIFANGGIQARPLR